MPTTGEPHLPPVAIGCAGSIEVPSADRGLTARVRQRHSDVARFIVVPVTRVVTGPVPWPRRRDGYVTAFPFDVGAQGG